MRLDQDRQRLPCPSERVERHTIEILDPRILGSQFRRLRQVGQPLLVALPSHHQSPQSILHQCARRIDHRRLFQYHLCLIRALHLLVQLREVDPRGKVPRLHLDRCPICLHRFLPSAEIRQYERLSHMPARPVIDRLERDEELGQDPLEFFRHLPYQATSCRCQQAHRLDPDSQRRVFEQRRQIPHPLVRRNRLEHPNRRPAHGGIRVMQRLADGRQSRRCQPLTELIHRRGPDDARNGDPLRSQPDEDRLRVSRPAPRTGELEPRVH